MTNVMRCKGQMSWFRQTDPERPRPGAQAVVSQAERKKLPEGLERGAEGYGFRGGLRKFRESRQLFARPAGIRHSADLLISGQRPGEMCFCGWVVRLHEIQLA